MNFVTSFDCRELRSIDQRHRRCSRRRIALSYRLAATRRVCKSWRLLPQIRVAWVEPIPNPVRLQCHRAQEAADRRATDVPTSCQPRRRASSSCKARTDHRDSEKTVFIRRLHDNGSELLPNVTLNHRRPTAALSIAQAIEAARDVALHPPTNDLPIDRQLRSDLVHLEPLGRQQHDPHALHDPVLRASSPNQYFNPLSWLAIELNPTLRYSACHPSFSKWFRRAATRFLLKNGRIRHAISCPQSDRYFGTQH